jgi:hypothetical protein
LYADVCRRLADDPRVAGVAPDHRWDLPVRLLGALHYLVLAEGVDSWSDPGRVVGEHADWISRFLGTQSVQTNEVQRTWALLPAFLALGARDLDLVELGPSAGLNLVWDSYRYRYEAGSWGAESAALELTGEERAQVPGELLARETHVVRRRGIDLSPVDVTTDAGARLLRCFVWADQPHRLERLDRAIEVLRENPPELIQGDYVELLPSVLADREDDALVVVFQTASTAYLTTERYEELRRILDEADRPLAWISTRKPFEEETGLEGGFELELAHWPDRQAELAARMGHHGQWLEWIG